MYSDGGKGTSHAGVVSETVKLNEERIRGKLYIIVVILNWILICCIDSSDYTIMELIKLPSLLLSQVLQIMELKNYLSVHNYYLSNSLKHEVVHTFCHVFLFDS